MMFCLFFCKVTKKIATFAMFRHQGAYIFVEDR